MSLTAVSSNLSPGAMEGFDDGESVILGVRLAQQLGTISRHDGDARRAQGRGHAVRQHAAHQDLSRRRHVRSRHVGIRPELHLHAADGGAALLRLRGHRERDPRHGHESRSGRTVARAARAGGRNDGQRLAADESQPVRRAAGRAQRDVPDPDAHHPGRGDEHHFRPHHAGEGQRRRHRDPAHDGCDARARSCACSSSPALRSARWARSSAC